MSSFFSYCHYSFLEHIFTEHNYTSDFMTAAAAAANAGTCLEDGNSDEKSGNVFENLVDAVNNVL